MQNLFLKGLAKMQVLKAAIVNDENGQDLIEYALVAALIAFAAVGAMGTLANGINEAFLEIGNKLNNAI